MIINTINFPKIENDTVTFSWHTDKSLPFFIKENFFIKYEGLNIQNFSMEVFWNAFLALMVPIYKLCGEEVVFVFPEHIPETLAETWINFHSANNVTIVPLSSKTSMPLYKSKHKCKDSNSKVGILFGGGKDSSYSFSVLSEIYGMENIVLISYIHPRNANNIEKAYKRREKYLLEKLRKDLNVKIQKIITDFIGITADVSYSYKPHTAIYTGTVLPVIQHYNINILTHNNDFLQYFTRYLNSSKNTFNFMRSRPEYDCYLSKKTNSLFNTDVSIINLSYFLSEPSAFKILAKRYPHMLKHLLMCEGVNGKWCLNCEKCCYYVLYSLCYGNEDPEIDYSSFFTRSSFIRKIINLPLDPNYMDKGNPNWPCSTELDDMVEYQSFCHILASINSKEAKEKLSEEAFKNLMILKKRYGNMRYPIFEEFIEPAFQKLNPPLVNKFKKIVTLYCPSVEEVPKFLYFGNKKVVIDYNVSCIINQVFNKEHCYIVEKQLCKKMKVPCNDLTR